MMYDKARDHLLEHLDIALRGFRHDACVSLAKTIAYLELAESYARRDRPGQEANVRVTFPANTEAR